MSKLFTPIALLLLLINSISCFGQQSDLCKYFKVEFVKRESKGKTSWGYHFKINTTYKDHLGKHIKKHHWIYDYLLINSFKGVDSLKQYCPDSNKINSIFCSQINDNQKFDGYFKILTPVKITHDSNTQTQYTVDEMMLVASHFFYCDKVSEKDTGIGSHICIGINGTREIKSEKDLTALEAFCFESIFNAMYKKKDPNFLIEFRENIRISLSKRIKHFTDFQSLLLDVRKDCYTEMMQNKDLKKHLLKYYKSNKKSFNFTIS